MSSETYAPNPVNCVLGKGKIYFDRFTAAGVSQGFFEIGNAKDLKAGYQSNRASLPNYTTADGGTYAESELTKEITVSCLVYEFNRKNIALLTGGTESTADYSLVDGTAGLIKLLTTGAATEGSPVTASYTAAVISGSSQKTVELYAAGNILGQLLYISDNSYGAQGELRYWKCSVQSGDLEGLIGDDFGSSTLSFKVMNDAAGAYGGSTASPYGRWFRR